MRVAVLAGLFGLAITTAVAGPFPNPHNAPTVGRPVEYQKMEMLDFKTDASTLIGKRVELSGLIGMFHGDIALMRAQQDDMHPVFVDVRTVSRDQRHRLQSCPAECPATVFGTTGTVSVGQVGVQADAISMLEYAE
jgi:hypothetical protein